MKNCPDQPFAKIDSINSIPCLRSMQTKCALKMSECLHEINYWDNPPEDHINQKIASYRYIIKEIKERVSYLIKQNKWV